MGSLHLAVEPWRAGLMRTWSHLPRPSNSRSQDGPGNEDLPARPVKVPRVGRPALDALLREQLLRINAETTSLPRCRRSTARIGWRVGWVAGPADTMTEAGRAGQVYNTKVPVAIPRFAATPVRRGVQGHAPELERGTMLFAAFATWPLVIPADSSDTTPQGPQRTCKIIKPPAYVIGAIRPQIRGWNWGSAERHRAGADVP